jgi:hypothetical protein
MLVNIPPEFGKYCSDVGKYPFLNRIIEMWNQFHCKLNKFRKRVMNVVTSKGIQGEIECK